MEKKKPKDEKEDLSDMGAAGSGASDTEENEEVEIKEEKDGADSGTPLPASKLPRSSSAASIAEARQQQIGACLTTPNKKKPELQRLRRLSSKSSVSRGDSMPEASGDGDDKDEEASAAGSTNTTPDGQDTKLKSRLDSLKLQEIIDGKKPGVAVHQSGLLMAKLSLSQQVILKSHLQLAAWCQLLAEASVGGASKAEILEAVAGLQGKVTWPQSLLYHMWRRELDSLTQALVVEASTEARVAEWWSTCQPWLGESDHEKQFDFGKPSLRFLDLDVKVKAEKFLGEYCAGIIIPLVLQGSDGVSKLRAYLPWLQQVPLGVVVSESGGI